MKIIQWKVEYLSPPKAIRYCKKCGTKTEYVSSEMFRVNAQQKILDVWLIYRCSHCKTTWNSTIHSRVNPKTIGEELLGKFQNNDAELARQYAMDSDLLMKNGAEIEPPAYKIVGNDFDSTQDVLVKIVSQYPSKLRLSKILREKLSLSKKVFDEMVAGGIIQIEDGLDIHKCKLKHELVVNISGKRAFAQKCDLLSPSVIMLLKSSKLLP